MSIPPELVSTPGPFAQWLMQMPGIMPVGEAQSEHFCPFSTFIHRHTRITLVSVSSLGVGKKPGPVYTDTSSIIAFLSDHSPEYLPTPAWLNRFIDKIDASREFGTPVLARECLETLRELEGLDSMQELETQLTDLFALPGPFRRWLLAHHPDAIAGIALDVADCPVARFTKEAIGLPCTVTGNRVLVHVGDFVTLYTVYAWWVRVFTNMVDNRADKKAITAAQCLSVLDVVEAETTNTHVWVEKNA